VKRLADLLLEKQRRGEKTFSIELALPLNNPSSLEEKLRYLKESKAGVDFVSVTMHQYPVAEEHPLGRVVKLVESEGYPCVAHITCNSYDKETLKRFITLNGFTNILALRGDTALSEEEWLRNAEENNHYAYAYQLVQDLASKGYCVGSAAFPEGYPGDSSLEKSLSALEEKQRAGASFAITQMVFSKQSYEEFLEKARGRGVTIPIIPGVKPLLSYESALKVEERFKVSIPSSYKARLAGLSVEDASREGLEACEELCRSLLRLEVPGIHLYSFHAFPESVELLERLQA